MDLNENTDIISIKFLGENKEVKITKDWLLKLKNISKPNIDPSALLRMEYKMFAKRYGK